VSSKAPQRNLREGWERAVKAAGITDFRWHDLRHTAASYLAMSGVSMVEIAKILGRESQQPDHDPVGGLSIATGALLNGGHRRLPATDEVSIEQGGEDSNTRLAVRCVQQLSY
jgi:hypothetical protein